MFLFLIKKQRQENKKKIEKIRKKQIKTEEKGRETRKAASTAVSP